jgi:hypothetical protein
MTASRRGGIYLSEHIKRIFLTLPVDEFNIRTKAKDARRHAVAWSSTPTTQGIEGGQQ